MTLQETRKMGQARKRKFLVFRIADKRYGIPLSLIKEVIALCPVTPIPQVPAYFKGMLNLRGQVISVVDLRIKLGFKDLQNDSKKTTILISQVGDVTLGTIVDEVVEVVGYEENQLETAADNDERGGDGVYGVAKDPDGSLTLLIDLKKSLRNTEFHVMRESA